MTKLSKTWWGQRFIEALEGFTDSGRLQRGRRYAGDSRILKFAINDGRVTATVRGNVNPYYGVYDEPRYNVEIQMSPIPAKDWKKIITHLGSKASMVSMLLMGEMPDTIDDAFVDVKRPLLPYSRKDFELTDCSCPDYANPCKHIAGVYYRLAAQLDRDPFLLFELRGFARDKLRAELSRTPLGEVLGVMMDEQVRQPEAAASYYTRPQPAATEPDYGSFWHGKKRLPRDIEPPAPAAVPAILIKKGGAAPAFWNKDGSFIDVMEEIYLRVRTKNRDVL